MYALPSAIDDLCLAARITGWLYSCLFACLSVCPCTFALQQYPECTRTKPVSLLVPPFAQTCVCVCVNETARAATSNCDTDAHGHGREIELLEMGVLFLLEADTVPMRVCLCVRARVHAFCERGFCGWVKS